MWFLIKNIVISILIIYSAHSLWNYILQTCTVKKKKDLVKFQQEKYASILNNASPVPNVSNDFDFETANDMNQYILDAMQNINIATDEADFAASSELVKK